MKKIRNGRILLKDIKFLENSRMRGIDDVGDLMRDIEQRGLMESVGIRDNDNALVYGNRRVKAFQKIGYKEIEADFYDDLTDDDLLIANLAENLKRKNIGGIETGRICEKLIDRGMTLTEIAEKLGVAKSRVGSAISAYRITKDTPFAKLVTYGTTGAGKKGIPESIIWKIQTSLYRGKILTKKDWRVLLKYIEKGKLTSHHISQLRKILMSDKTLDMEEAMEILEKCRVINTYLCLDEERLNTLMKKHKYDSETGFIKHILREYDEELIF